MAPSVPSRRCQRPLSAIARAAPESAAGSWDRTACRCVRPSATHVGGHRCRASGDHRRRRPVRAPRSAAGRYTFRVTKNGYVTSHTARRSRTTRRNWSTSRGKPGVGQHQRGPAARRGHHRHVRRRVRRAGRPTPRCVPMQKPGTGAMRADADGTIGNDATTSASSESMAWRRDSILSRRVRNPMNFDLESLGHQAGYAPVYYPGTANVDEAQPCERSASEKRSATSSCR